MEDKICLDTDVIVNFLRNKKEERDYVLSQESHVIFATTFVNLFELYYGAYKSGRTQNILQLEELQHRLTILNLSKAAVQKSGQVIATLEKSGNKIEFRDLFIGCIAQTEGFCIKTNNKKHFEKIPELVIK